MEDGGTNNYYTLLGVDRDAPIDVIRDSYRRLMQQAAFHPDLGGDTHTAALINKAYSVLRNPALREDYDQRLNILSCVTGGFEIETAPAKRSSGKRCLFCGERHDYVVDVDDDIGCDTCGSPLRAVEVRRFETDDVRAVHRLGNQLDVLLFTHWAQQTGHWARTEDISPRGLRMITRCELQQGQRVRLMSRVLEAIGEITHSTARRDGWRSSTVAGVSFLTLRFRKSVGGFVSRRI